MSAFAGIALSVGVIAATWTLAFIAAQVVRTGQSLDDALDEIAHGDRPHVPTCEELMVSLSTVPGGCSERGFVGRHHPNGDTL